MSIPEKAVYIFPKHCGRNELLAARLFFDTPQINQESKPHNKSETRILYR
jgi:hypothetical protein